MKSIFSLRLALLAMLILSCTGRSADKGTGEGAPQLSAMDLESEPEDAQFEILARNGFVVKTGKAPATVRELAADAYNVTFRQSGYIAQRYIVELGPEQILVKGDFTLQREWKSVEGASEEQQKQINIGNTLAQSIGPEILRDLALMSFGNKEIKALLSKHGYNVQGSAEDAAKAKIAPATPAPMSTPAPTAANAPGAPAWRPSQEPVITWDAETEKQWKDGVEKWRQFVKRREALVKQSLDIQTKLQALIMDILILAKTNDDAKEIVRKYNIQRGPQN